MAHVKLYYIFLQFFYYFIHHLVKVKIRQQKVCFPVHQMRAKANIRTFVHTHQTFHHYLQNISAHIRRISDIKDYTFAFGLDSTSTFDFIGLVAAIFTDSGHDNHFFEMRNVWKQERRLSFYDGLYYAANCLLQQLIVSHEKLTSCGRGDRVAHHQKFQVQLANKAQIIHATVLCACHLINDSSFTNQVFCFKIFVLQLCFQFDTESLKEKIVLESSRQKVSFTVFHFQQTLEVITQTV